VGKIYGFLDSGSGLSLSQVNHLFHVQLGWKISLKPIHIGSCTIAASRHINIFCHNTPLSKKKHSRFCRLLQWQVIKVKLFATLTACMTTLPLQPYPHSPQCSIPAEFPACKSIIICSLHTHKMYK